MSRVLSKDCPKWYGARVEKYLRIGGLSELTGVTPDALRAWERRYGLLQPARTPGGFRLYGDDDARRIRTMQRLMAEGLSASEAAQRALTGEAGERQASEVAEEPLDRLRDAFARTLVALDEPALQAAVDDLLARFDIDTVIRDVLLPALHRLGEEWAAGTVSVAQEHFGVNIVRDRLVALGRGWDRGLGPRALLACPPGQLHDVSLVMFGLALRRRGWRVSFLGANTPLSSVKEAVDALRPEVAVLYSPNWAEHKGVEGELAALGERVDLSLAAGTAAALAADVGARLLSSDPVSAADELTEAVAERRRR